MRADTQKSLEPFELEHFSYSQLFTYLMCPAKYAHNYVWGTPYETLPVVLSIGRAVHKSAEAYYVNLLTTGEVLEIEHLIDVFNKAFDEDVKDPDIEIDLGEGETIESMREKGHMLVCLFHSGITPQEVKAVEYRFSVKVPDLVNGGDLPFELVGYYDLVEYDGESHVVVDLKTAGQRFSAQKLEHDLQATIYTYAMTQLGLADNPESALMRYDVLLRTKKPAFEKYYVTRTEADFDRLIQLINQVVRAIQLGVFYRNTGWQCDGCQFRSACLGDA
jgi:CRISPR/Cas system-associated exonuclease Cas4 (RecB family)